MMNKSEFLPIPCNLLKAREKSRVQSAIGFGFAPHWSKRRPEIFKPINERSNRNHVSIFDSHSKIAIIHDTFDWCIRYMGNLLFHTFI